MHGPHLGSASAAIRAFASTGSASTRSTLPVICSYFLAMKCLRFANARHGADLLRRTHTHKLLIGGYVWLIDGKFRIFGRYLERGADLVVEPISGGPIHSCTPLVFSSE